MKVDYSIVNALDQFIMRHGTEIEEHSLVGTDIQIVFDGGSLWIDAKECEKDPVELLDKVCMLTDTYTGHPNISTKCDSMGNIEEIIYKNFKFTYDSAHKFVYALYEEDTFDNDYEDVHVDYENKCCCGAASVGSTRHASYCPMYRE